MVVAEMNLPNVFLKEHFAGTCWKSRLHLVVAGFAEGWVEARCRKDVKLHMPRMKYPKTCSNVPELQRAGPPLVLAKSKGKNSGRMTDGCVNQGFFNDNGNWIVDTLY